MAAKKKTGKPTKLTPETHKKIIDAVREGNYAKTAAALAGINEATVIAWVNRGREEGSGIYHEFAKDIEVAKAQAQADHVGNIKRISKDQWTASAWYLERTDWKNWGKKDQLSIAAEVKHEHGINQASVEDLLIKIEQARELKDGSEEKTIDVQITPTESAE